MTFGAKADYDTKAGTYNLALNFQATANPLISYIQDYDNTTCATEASSESVTVIDERDNNDYQVRYINGNCWMVQNLRYMGDTVGSTSSSMIMKADTSNISTDQNLTIGDLTLGNDYNSARIHDSGNTTNGVWYNYAAVSAGYVTSNQNSTVESAESVCPKNWRLPTNSEMSGITSYQSAFFNDGSPVTGGLYNNGSVSATGYGYWWSSTPGSSGSNFRYYLSYDGSSLGTGNGRRDFGFYVRCIRSTYMQDFSSTDAAAMNVGDTRILTDSRDGQAYTVRKLPDNNVWMVQNLRYVGDTGSTSSSMIMKADTSNISTDQNLTIGDLTSGNSYDEAMIHVATSDQVPSGASYTATDMGVWYNYAVASAMTITGSSNTNTQTYDICPKNWRLPTNSEQSGITIYKDAFSPVTGGYYNDGSVTNTGYGYWWSATSYGSAYRYYLYYNGSSLNTGIHYRNLGFYVRCIRSN